METYQESLFTFHREFARGRYEEAVQAINRCIDLAQDLDLMPKLNTLRREALRRIPKEKKAWRFWNRGAA